MTIKDMGKAINTRRLELGITKAELSRCSGVSVSSIKTFESGKANLSIDNVSRLCVSLGLELKVVAND